MLQVQSRNSHSPGEAHGEAGCLSATYRYQVEQISICSHGGAHRQQQKWLKELQPMDIPTEAALGQSCSPWKQSMVGQEGWKNCTCGNSALLKVALHGMELCWGSAGTAVVCGKATWYQFGKDGICGRVRTWSRGRE